MKKADDALGVQFKFTEWLTGAVPDPASDMVIAEFAALLVTTTLPERLPAVVGANVTLKAVDCPAASVSGTGKAPILNPGPVSLICEMEMPELPLFVSVMLCAALPPVVKLPKLSADEDAVS